MLLRVERKNTLGRIWDVRGGTSIDFVVAGMVDQEYYNFIVERDTQDQIIVNNCYQFTYYPITSFTEKHICVPSYPDKIEYIDTLTGIEHVFCP